MKDLTYAHLFAILTFFLLAISCEPASLPLIEEREQSYFDLPSDQDINKRLNKSNLQNGHQPGSPLASFVAEGPLEIFAGFDQEQSINFIRVSLSEQTKRGILRTALFEVQLDEAIDFPPSIPAGKIIYLQNQLIIIDLDKSTATNFFVDDGIHGNAFASAPAVNSLSLMLQRGDDALNGNLKSSSCSCSCRRCYGGQDCGSAQASCSCGGNSQSKACRDGYNAECTDCGDGPQQ